MPRFDSVTTANIDLLAQRAIGLMIPDGRVILGIAGSPGAGKTTIAQALVARINEILRTTDAVYLPMDGYHLANSTLDRLGNHDRKGAIDTFDGWGFVALIRRIAVELDHVVYAPSFDRTVDEGIAGEIAVPAGAAIVIVEGNYLLVDEKPWSSLAGLFAETWFCETSETERLARLVDRHERHGRSAEAARDWAQNVDGANARVIEASRVRADRVISGVDARIL